MTLIEPPETIFIIHINDPDVGERHKMASIAV